MKKVSKETLLETAHNLMFDIDEEQLRILSEEYEDIFEATKNIQIIPGVDEVEPMVFPYEIFGELREDSPSSSLSLEEALKNAENVRDGHIVIPKVVK
ncbi:MAG TPA: Asp-tRNA(Asn)/Glu-tRNA(Gln) amidotransferase subunit GatC [Erysipelotrichaceae bacterium]|nr:Asp-tRNA(Asn)/Glu-tRNA(Gln) amidotransferase subunit GatC [Erysipelotrichaceae bacterium]